MSWLLAKTAASPLFSLSPPHNHHHRHRHRVAILSSLLRQHLSTKPSPQTQKEPPFMAEYLVSSFGFSPNRALHVSKRANLAAIKSIDRPEAVTRFLRDTGLSDAQIKVAVSLYPIILSYNVDTLKPKALQFIQNGFSQKLLILLIRYCPAAFVLKKTLSRLLFWRNFVHNSEEDLLEFIQRTRHLILLDIDSYIVPRINILKEYGLSNRDIFNLLVDGNRCFNHKLDSLRQIIELIEELGIVRGSNKFFYALKAVGSFSKDKIQKRTELYQTAYEWSKEDVRSAFEKHPCVLAYSEDKIKSNMKFLIEITKLEPRSIASQPKMLGFSLQKRLEPRHRVLCILHANGLKKNCNLFTACSQTENSFLEKFVDPYKKDVPELAEIYLDACGMQMSV